MFGAEGLWRLLEGQVIKDQFYLQALLGAGTYGGVFRTDEVVRDTCLRSLATKLISLQNPDQVGVQLQELQIALSLDHPNLIRCYGAGEATLASNAFLYLLMELAEGTLQDRLEQGSVPPETLKLIIRDVAAGLAHLHQSQQSHLDIKPGNILKVGDRWKIGDYGLVRTLNPTRTYTFTRNALGTPLYMPPESYDGILSPAWDVWSLGIMAVNLLTGQYPIRHRTENELSEKIKTGNFDNLQWDALPSPWRSIIQGCLQVNRGDRWSAEQILEVLNPKTLMSTIQYSDSVIDVHQSNIKANLEEPIEQKKFINLEITRRTLKYKILRQIKKGFDLGFYELSVKPLYIKAWHLYCSFFIMQSEMRKCNYTDESRLELENIFWKDHKSLLFYGAPYSWLVISDEDKFENWTSELDPKALEIQTKRLPQDIHYGLILKHYLPLSAVCNYTAGFNIEEYQAELPERDFERTKELALEYVSLNMRDPTMTIDRVRDIVSDVDMRF